MAERDHVDRLPWMAVGVAPFVAALALVPLRDSMRNANVALVLVAVVVAVAVAGGRPAGLAAALASSVAFDVLHTRPYLHLVIRSGDDVETTVLLLLVGVVVGHVATVGRRSRRRLEARQGELRRLYRIAELAVRSDDAFDVIAATQDELVSLLGLRSCRFGAPPFATALERLERNGAVCWQRYRRTADGFELPADGVELPVVGCGRLLGRFVLHPTPNRGASLEQRVVAVALADQVGLALSAPRPGRET